ncbi:MAG: DUF389 domain-containing protein [Pyrinomonadaceae bacterium]
MKLKQLHSLKKLKRFLRFTASLMGGTDAEGTIEEISQNVALRGANIWMLVCSAILASIGLDVNSTAVIIGAMLISPLMSPILGVGLGIAIHDRRLLTAALKNLVFATFLSLLTSFVYFFISPFGDLTPELSARITPTILDVGVAFFGGVAGIVAGSRRNKTNAIPGVAIATALMPPICTAGYGLAKMSSSVFLGAFYLYFINAVFIALATYLISKWLKFPHRTPVDEEQETTVRRFIIGFVIVVIIPSALIFYNVLEKLQFDKGVKDFVNTKVRTDNRQPIQWKIIEKTSPQTLKVYTVGQAASDEQKRELQQTLDGYNIGDLKLDLVQLNVSPDEFNRLTSDVQTNLSEKMSLLQSVEDERKQTIETLQAQIADLQENAKPDKTFFNDVKWIFPEMADVAWQNLTTDDSENPSNQFKTLVVTFKENAAAAAKSAALARLQRLAQSRFADTRFRVVEKPPPPPPTDANENESQGQDNANVSKQKTQ